MSSTDNRIRKSDIIMTMVGFAVAMTLLVTSVAVLAYAFGKGWL